MAAPWKEAPWNAQLLGGPEPRAMALHQQQTQFPHFPQRYFSPSPLHPGLRGSCTIPWELQMWPRITHGTRNAFLTHKSTQLKGLPAPVSPTQVSRPAAVPLPPPRLRL